MKLRQTSRVAEDSERVATFEVVQPNGEPYRSSDGKPCTISHTGPESKAYRRVREQIDRQSLRQRRSKLEPKDILDRRIALAGAPVTAWANWENEDGSPAVLSPEALRELLSVDHILQQLEEEIAAHGGAGSFFTSASETASTPSS